MYVLHVLHNNEHAAISLNVHMYVVHGCIPERCLFVYGFLWDKYFANCPKTEFRRINFRGQSDPVLQQ